MNTDVTVGSGQVTQAIEWLVDPDPPATDPGRQFASQHTPDGKVVLTASNGFFDPGIRASDTAEVQDAADSNIIGPDFATLGPRRFSDIKRTSAKIHVPLPGLRLLAGQSATVTVFHGPEDCLTFDHDLGGLAILDKQAALYAHTVPRGAQTWEMPLHTPDIMASAHMIRAYVYGYVLSGNNDYLAHARYWAWSGVPFLYLVNPTDGACGPYATIGVLGATNWAAPVWIGQPVQWCGLVYGSALHLLSRFDDSGPWNHLARGITIAGLQMTWPTDDAERQGLLPDYFHLHRQISDGPAINPGTVNAHLPEAFGKGTLHTFHRFQNGSILHAPCAITEIRETATNLRFSVSGWGNQPYPLLLSGVDAPPAHITANGKSVTATHHPDQDILVIPLRGPSQLKIELTK